MKKIAINLIMVLVLAVSVTAVCNFGPDLLGFWSFDAGDATDDSDNSNDGTVTGAVSTIGNVSQGMEFSSADTDRINIPDAAVLRPADELSLEAWVKLDLAGMGDQRFIIAKIHGPIFNWNSYGMLISADDKFKFTVQNQVGGDFPQWEAQTVLAEDTWYHLVATWKPVSFDANDVKLYINGQPVAADFIVGGYAPGFTIQYEAKDLLIGSFYNVVPTAYRLGMEGVIDEVAIYDRELSAAEVLNHYDENILGNNICLLSEGQEGGAIPEFSTVGMLLALAIAALGIAYVIKKK